MSVLLSWNRSRSNDREIKSLGEQRERILSAQRTFETDLNDMRMRENNLRNEIRDKEALQASIVQMKQDIENLAVKLKVQ